MDIDKNSKSDDYLNIINEIEWNGWLIVYF